MSYAAASCDTDASPAMRAADDVATCRVGEGPEHPVHLVVGELSFYNHLVVR